MKLCILNPFLKERTTSQLPKLGSTLLVIMVGFEEPSYTFNEDQYTGEICVVVTNPPPTEDLASVIYLTTTSRLITARKLL